MDRLAWYRCPRIVSQKVLVKLVRCDVSMGMLVKHRSTPALQVTWLARHREFIFFGRFNGTLTACCDWGVYGYVCMHKKYTLSLYITYHITYITIYVYMGYPAKHVSLVRYVLAAGRWFCMSFPFVFICVTVFYLYLGLTAGVVLLWVFLGCICVQYIW